MRTLLSVGLPFAQCYVSFPPHAAQPPRQLRAWTRVDARAGASVRVALSLAPRDLAVWDDAAAHGWKPVAGKFEVACGPSSRELPLSSPMVVG